MQATIEQRKQHDYERYYREEFERVWQDETTWVAETLNAPLEKERIYRLQDGELFSEEGVGLGKVFGDSVEYYRKKAESDPSKQFLYERSLLEDGELHEMTAMAHGSGPNTMAVFSTYPEQLTEATEDVEGYKHKQKTGFIRVIKRKPDNTISMWTHTFDGDDQDSVKAMFKRTGHTLDPSCDPLGQRVRLDLDSDAQELLGDELLLAYDQTLHKKHGGHWFAGRNETDRREAIKFVESQVDLVKTHVAFTVDHGQKVERMKRQRYDFALAMKRRFEGNMIVARSVASEMSGAGDSGRANGESVSGCGLTISSPNQNTEQALAEAGYKLERPKAGFDDCMQCPHCKNRGVQVDINGKNIFYTCASGGGCGATTKPKTEQQRSKRVISNERKDSKTLSTIERASTKALIVQSYGKYARLSQQIVIGGVVKEVRDTRTDELIAKL